MPERTCSVDGCLRAHRARGLCSTHYNQTHCPPEVRYRKVTVACDWCGKPCTKDAGRRNQYVTLFCTLPCRDAYRAFNAGRDRCPIPDGHPAHREYRLPAPWVRPPRSVARPRWPRCFVAGICVVCGNHYVAEDYTNTARYCSSVCAKRSNRLRYRARKKQAYVAHVSPVQIFKRDGWRCQLCKGKVRRDRTAPHPLAPVLDHVVPLAAGGTHEPANTQCAHFWCNSAKGSRGKPEQLMLIG